MDRKKMHTQGKEMHQSLISCALEGQAYFPLYKYLSLTETPEPPPRWNSQSLLHVYVWHVGRVVMFLMKGTSDLSRVIVRPQETVLMIHWSWLQAPSELHNTYIHPHNDKIDHKGVAFMDNS